VGESYVMRLLPIALHGMVWIYTVLLKEPRNERKRKNVKSREKKVAAHLIVVEAKERGLEKDASIRYGDSEPSTGTRCRRTKDNGKGTGGGGNVID